MIIPVQNVIFFNITGTNINLFLQLRILLIVPLLYIEKLMFLNWNELKRRVWFDAPKLTLLRGHSSWILRPLKKLRASFQTSLMFFSLIFLLTCNHYLLMKKKKEQSDCKKHHELLNTSRCMSLFETYLWDLHETISEFCKLDFIFFLDGNKKLLMKTRKNVK